MTKRKPPGVSHEHWVDRLVREAREQGQFDDLPGEGEPLEKVDAIHDPMWWVKRFLKREGVSILPRELELRREVASAMQEILRLPTEQRVRERVEEVNRRIRGHNATVTAGPPTSLTTMDPGQVVEAWRRARSKEGS